MLTLYRRHRAKCKSSSRTAKCFCPIWVQGVLRGEPVRKSTDLTNWEAANKLVRDWEIHGKDVSVSVSEALTRWISDCEARNLAPSSLRKYWQLKGTLVEAWGDKPLKSLAVDDVRLLRESWTYAPGTMTKRLELLRSIFTFCIDSGWIDKNPAKSVKAPQHKRVPTLPYSDSEWKDIVTALDVYGEIHSQSPARIQKQLRALFLLMRYSGLRISDSVGLERARIDSLGQVFLYQAKTGEPVFVPLPEIALQALRDVDEEGRRFFWNGEGTLKTVTTDWSARMKKVFVLAGIPDGHSHRLRDTFAVGLLLKGTPIETVAALLGNTVQVCQKHYSPWVRSRQDALTDAVKATWA